MITATNETRLVENNFDVSTATRINLKEVLITEDFFQGLPSDLNNFL